MMPAPFAHLAQYPELDVAIFSRSDNVRSDAEAASLMGYEHAAGLHHVHGARSIVVREPSARTERADGMWTDVPGLVLCTRWADCQNFVAYAPKRRVVGVLHAGWRGIVAEAIPAFVRLAQEEWGIPPEEIYVGAGPSLCQRCADFSDPARELPNVPTRLVNDRCVDLQQAAHEQWQAAGVVAKHLERHADCTRCLPERYWTYRGGHRENVANGQSNIMAAALRSR